MRKSIDGLLGVVKGALAEDPLTGTLYIFVNRRGNYMKSVFWDRTGFCLFAKRLERGRFHFPGEETTQELSARALELILDGIVLGPRKVNAVKTMHDVNNA
jgi:transposase